MSRFDIFISYNWDVKEAVKLLYQELTNKHNLKVWMDEYEMGQKRLSEELSTAISNSTLFLCCITQKYAQSENCKDELDYAKNLKKKMIILMFERISMEELGGVGFIIGPRVRFNCYKNPEMFHKWSGNQIFDSILSAIKDELNERSGFKSNGNEKDTLHSNESLQEEQLLVSTNRNYFALIQKDGNFVLYKSLTFSRNNPLWASNTWHFKNPKPFKLTLLSNGNLVLGDLNNTPVWTSNSQNKGQSGDYKLTLQNDGNLVLYDKVMSPIWASNTWNN